jgi:hypothetical protein
MSQALTEQQLLEHLCEVCKHLQEDAKKPVEILLAEFFATVIASPKLLSLATHILSHQ